MPNNGHYTYDGVKSILQSNIATVSFTKVSGDYRKMTCTLLPGYLPVNDTPTVPTPGRAVGTTSLSVWDLQQNNWRAFRIDSIESVDYPVSDDYSLTNTIPVTITTTE